MKQRVLVLIICLVISHVYPISIVYNMRVRRTFSGSGDLIGKKDQPIGLATALPIFERRTRTITQFGPALDETTLFGGTLLNLRGIGKRRKWWIEGTTAIAKESTHLMGAQEIKGSRTGFDDIVVAVGRNFFPTQHVQCTLYGIAGIPTKFSVQGQVTPEPLVGTRFYGTGVGSEFSYGVVNKEKFQSYAVIFQNRFIHFYNRRFFPVLPRDAKIQPGNLIDLLGSFRFTFQTNLIESGYDCTIFNNQGVIRPTGKTTTPNFYRHSYYLNYLRLMRSITFFSQPLALGTGFSYSHSKTLDTKIFICWINASVIF